MSNARIVILGIAAGHVAYLLALSGLVPLWFLPVLIIWSAVELSNMGAFDDDA